MEHDESLRKNLSDMLAVAEHIRDAIERQRASDRLKQHVQANKVVIEVERVLNEHIEALNDLVHHYDADTQSVAKEALTRALGVAAGLYDRVRGKQPLSRDLRDDYTALSLAAMAYTTLHTWGLAAGEERVADLAQEHLKDLTPLLVEISKVLPAVVVHEMKEESDFAVDETILPQAVTNTQAAWEHEVTERAPTAESGT